MAHYNNAATLAASTLLHRPTLAVYCGTAGTLTFYPESVIINHSNNYPNFASSGNPVTFANVSAGSILTIGTRWATAVPSNTIALWAQ